jgi:hypothetical protein
MVGQFSVFFKKKIKKVAQNRTKSHKIAQDNIKFLHYHTPLNLNLVIPSARGPYMLRSSFVLVLIGYGCWRGATILGLK